LEILILLTMGALAGTMAGLLGIGGGVIIVPVLAWVFEGQGVSPDVLMHVAVGTSLATIMATSVSSIHAHHKRGAIQWPVFLSITPGIIGGSLLGSVIAGLLSGQTLRISFGLFILFVAFQMARGMTSRPHRTLPGNVGMAAVGILIGAVSAMMGIGGGAMSVPFMTWCNMDARKAVATAAAIGFPIAVTGTLGFLINGWGNPDLPAASIGYINLPAFAGIVGASILFAPLGARIAHRIPQLTLKRFFAVFLAVMGIRMLLF